MTKFYGPVVILTASLWLTQHCPAQNPIVQTMHTADRAPLAPIPAVPTPQAQDSVPMGDVKSFPEMKLDIPVAPGPFEPTWESIEKNYPGEPAWLREAKFGIWVHFGPQSAGESGDWYARRLYTPGTSAYQESSQEIRSSVRGRLQGSPARLESDQARSRRAHEDLSGCRRALPDDPGRASRQLRFVELALSAVEFRQPRTEARSARRMGQGVSRGRHAFWHHVPSRIHLVVVADGVWQ